MAKGIVLLCAGGTGGHLFPAQAVAHAMQDRGYSVHLAADDRAARFAGEFPADELHEIRSATVASKNPVALAKTGMALLTGYLQSRKLVRRLDPVVVAGFGGYPTVPPLVAAAHLGKPTLVHEANAVLGRANRLLSRYVDRIAIGFGTTARTDGLDVVVTGNPVRPQILEAAKHGYPPRNEDDPFNLLVFGGSQGAAFFSDSIPAACQALPREIASRLRIVQQARPEDVDRVKAGFEKLGIEAHIAPFFDDMAARLAASHLVISRAGASTVSELAVVGRPAILVPYPHALDHDQASNAAAVSAEGGATLFNQSALVPAVLADEIANAVRNPKTLALAAKNAKKTGKPDAALQLADMLEALAAR
ncbi:MAG: undecaprenyldiphospho-muramoylpentapeptide beta-N-acetylglucosaminyltransferase [Pseudomonadota bacterium]